MPTVSPSQYGFMQAVRSGKVRGKGPSPEVAKEFIDATPPEKRSQYARVLAKRRKSRKSNRSGGR